MFAIFPWRVDVPQDRYPIVNWLIIAVTVGVFAVQVRDLIRYEASRRQDVPRALPGAPRLRQPVESEANAPEPISPPGITGELMLDGWGLKGLFGHMWLHGGLFHLLGNMWFLWLFGNAVCAKIGNARYLALYLVLGLAAGVTHLLFSSGNALGASGAINGVVGMYLVLFFENEITCYFFFWFVFFTLRQFAVSSCWMILFWLFWDVFGAFVWSGDSNVAYFAHLGGFGAGFGIMLVMCRMGWVTMEHYEKSLVQWWQERWPGNADTDSLQRAYAQLGMLASPAEPAPTPSQAPAQQEPEQFASVPVSRVPVRATCSSGHTLSVSGQYAGKAVRCPRCGQTIMIPGPPAASRATRLKLARAGAAQDSSADKYIRFACACGRRLKVPAIHAGRSGTCPRCGAKVAVPRPGQ